MKINGRMIAIIALGVLATALLVTAVWLGISALEDGSTPPPATSTSEEWTDNY